MLSAEKPKWAVVALKYEENVPIDKGAKERIVSYHEDYKKAESERDRLRGEGYDADIRLSSQLGPIQYVGSAEGKCVWCEERFHDVKQRIEHEQECKKKPIS